MLQKFGLYDFLANLIPGLAFLWALSWLGQFFGHTPIIPISESIGDASVLIAWAFIVGLLIQGVAQGVVERIVLAVTGGFPSSRWLFDGGKGFTEEHRRQLKGAIDQKKLSDRPLTFNAHYGLFRALFTFALALLAVFGSTLALKWKEILQRDSLALFQAILLFLILASVISYFRMQKRGEDFAKSIYDLFFAFYRQESIAKKHTEVALPTK